MIKIALADDHSIVRNGLKQLLSMVGGLDVVAEAVNGAEVIALCARTDIDIAPAALTAATAMTSAGSSQAAQSNSTMPYRLANSGVGTEPGSRSNSESE